MADPKMMMAAMLQSAVYPMLAASIIALVLAQVLKKHDRDWPAGLAVAAGFIASFIAISGMGFIKPIKVIDWMPYLALLPVIFVPLVEKKGIPLRLVGGFIIAGITTFIFLRPLTRSWSTGETIGWMALGIVILMALWTAWEVTLEEDESKPERLLVMVVIATGASLVGVLGESALVGQLNGAIAAACGAMFLIKLLRPQLKLGSTLNAVFLVLLGAGLLNAYFYVEVNWISLLLICLAGLSIVASRLAFIAEAGLPKRAALSVVIALIPVIVSILLIALGSSGEDEYDYY